MTTESTVLPAPADIEAARAALPEAVFSLPVFQPLEAAKAYIGALNIMCLDQDIPEHFGKPLYRLVCDVSDILDEVECEVRKVYDLARRATGMPDPPDDDDGNGDVEDSAGDTELIVLGERLKAAYAAEREAFARDCSHEEGDALHKACSAIARKIEKTHATTLAGLSVKAAAIDWCCGSKPFADDDDTTDKRLVTSLLTDLEAMQAAA